MAHLTNREAAICEEESDNNSEIPDEEMDREPNKSWEDKNQEESVGDRDEVFNGTRNEDMEIRTGQVSLVADHTGVMEGDKKKLHGKPSSRKPSPSTFRPEVSLMTGHPRPVAQHSLPAPHQPST